MTETYGHCTTVTVVLVSNDPETGDESTRTLSLLVNQDDPYEEARLHECEKVDPVEMKWPPLDNGVRVITTKSHSRKGDWTEEA